MRTTFIAIALLLLAAGVASLPNLVAQEEPSIAPEPDLEEPTLEAEPEPTARPFRPGVLQGEPLRARLDFDRWLEMSFRERQTFVEGAVLTLAAVAQRLRGDLAIAEGRVPPEGLEAVVRFVHDHHPKLPPADYLAEMDRIYLTAEGQNLSMLECFQLAFGRLNRR